MAKKHKQQLKSNSTQEANMDQAFHDYYTLGADRSIRKLLAKYKDQKAKGQSVPTLTESTLQRWSIDGKWNQKIQDLVQELIENYQKTAKEKQLEELEFQDKNSLEMIKELWQEWGEWKKGKTSVIPTNIMETIRKISLDRCKLFRLTSASEAEIEARIRLAVDQAKEQEARELIGILKDYPDALEAVASAFSTKEIEGEISIDVESEG